ncbi:MAG: hypothetical protein IJ679_12635, partial [Lachnospiraceae bacterium]|nr:hypothetical protein [Lachnospiraceae bacterium]
LNFNGKALSVVGFGAFSDIAKHAQFTINAPKKKLSGIETILRASVLPKHATISKAETNTQGTTQQR